MDASLRFHAASTSLGPYCFRVVSAGLHAVGREAGQLWHSTVGGTGYRRSSGAERRAEFCEASSLGPACPDDRWVLIDIEKASVHHANQPEGSNLCKIMLRSVTHLSTLLDPRSSYAAHGPKLEGAAARSRSDLQRGVFQRVSAEVDGQVLCQILSCRVAH